MPQQHPTPQPQTQLQPRARSQPQVQQNVKPKPESEAHPTATDRGVVDKAADEADAKADAAAFLASLQASSLAAGRPLSLRAASDLSQPSSPANFDRSDNVTSGDDDDDDPISRHLDSLDEDPISQHLNDEGPDDKANGLDREEDDDQDDDSPEDTGLQRGVHVNVARILASASLAAVVDNDNATETSTPSSPASSLLSPTSPAAPRRNKRVASFDTVNSALTDETMDHLMGGAGDSTSGSLRRDSLSLRRDSTDCSPLQVLHRRRHRNGSQASSSSELMVIPDSPVQTAAGDSTEHGTPTKQTRSLEGRAPNPFLGLLGHHQHHSHVATAVDPDTRKPADSASLLPPVAPHNTPVTLSTTVPAASSSTTSSLNPNDTPTTIIKLDDVLELGSMIEETTRHRRHGIASHYRESLTLGDSDDDGDDDGDGGDAHGDGGSGDDDDNGDDNDSLGSGRTEDATRGDGQAKLEQRRLSRERLDAWIKHVPDLDPNQDDKLDGRGISGSGAKKLGGSGATSPRLSVGMGMDMSMGAAGADLVLGEVDAALNKLGSTSSALSVSSFGTDEGLSGAPSAAGAFAKAGAATRD